MNVLMKAMEIKNNRRVYLRSYENMYGITLLKHQLELIECKDRFIEKKFKRQVGGTTALLIKAMDFAINNNESSVVVACNSLLQAHMHMKIIANLTDSNYASRHILRYGKNPNYIKFTNGSQIDFISCQSINNSRGKKIDCLIIDGKEYISKEALDILYASTLHSNDSQIVILS